MSDMDDMYSSDGSEQDDAVNVAEESARIARAAREREAASPVVRAAREALDSISLDGVDRTVARVRQLADQLAEGWTDGIHQTTHITFDLLDRLKVLVGGVVVSRVRTDVLVRGRRFDSIETDSYSYVEPPAWWPLAEGNVRQWAFWRRPYAAVMDAKAPCRPEAGSADPLPPNGQVNAPERQPVQPACGTCGRPCRDRCIRTQRPGGQFAWACSAACGDRLAR